VEERRLAAIMFTDVVGYSALTQWDEALALELLDTKRQLLNPLLNQHKGVLIKTMGDGFLVEFASALQAIKCAVAIQNTLHGYNASQPEESRLNLRIGIHLGDVEHRDGDVFGDGVNIASRIEPLAEPGGVCLTRQVFDHVENKLDAPLINLGKQQLKNIERSLEVYKVELPWMESAPAQESPSAPPAKSPDELRKSIAVLPFQNMSPDPENEYFSDGLTEDILAQLAKIRDLKVISRTSIMQYKNTSKNLRRVGSELGVGTILEGSVRRAGGRVRVTAQLIDARTDEHLWAETYDRELDDIFAIQSDVAQQIAQALETQISPEVQARIERRPTDNLEAYQLYLKGLHQWNQRSDESVKKGIECFEQAIKLDPNYALAHVGLADCYVVLGNFGSYSPQEIYPKAKAAATRALELDDSLGEAYASLAQIQMSYDWDWEGAERSHRKAIALSPGYATAHHWYGYFLMFQGEFDRALAELHKAQELDPLSPIIVCNASFVHYFARRYDEALAVVQKAIEIDPSFPFAYSYMGFIHSGMESPGEAVAVYEKARELTGSWDLIDEMCLGLAYAQASRREEALEILTEMLERRRKGYVSPVFISFVYLGLGRQEKALDWLETACEERDDWLRVLKVHPLLDELREEPRFIELLQKVGLDS
jgi:TolB-like protein/Flp pilus assembly protein TadD